MENSFGRFVRIGCGANLRLLFLAVSTGAAGAMVSGCGGGGGVPPPPSTAPAPAPGPAPGPAPAPSPSAFSISGIITAATSALVDSDVNDPNAPFTSNDTASSAQPLRNPGQAGGFASAVGSGVAGSRFANAGDTLDVYSVQAAAGQTITLRLHDYIAATPTVVDLDLSLYTSDGNLLNESMGTGQTESITTTHAGSFLIVVNAFAGASTYTLSVGTSPSPSTHHDLASSAEFIPGEVIVRFKDEALPATATGFAQREHAAAIGLSTKAGGQAGRPLLLSLGTAAMRRETLARLGVQPDGKAKSFAKTSDAALQDKLDTLLAVKRLRTRADVASADLNYLQKASAQPNDQHYRFQWHYPLINLPQAWDITTGSPDVVVAVIDTGVVLAHPDLAANLTSTGFDFISDPANALDGDGIDNDPDDPGDSKNRAKSSWHGTHVAGTVAAVSNNGTGVAGVSWSSKVMPLRVLGKSGGSLFDIMQAVRYAAGLPNDSGTTPARRADVINLSLGGGPPAQFAQDDFTAVRNASVIVIAAAGNENSGVPSYPASYAGVVSVSAVDMNKHKAPYSNFGAAVDVAAPGGDTAVDLNGDRFADGVLSTLVDEGSGMRQTSFEFYQGTSMAAPHVAGVAALMMAVRKAAGSTLTPDEFDALLAAGSITNELGTPGRDDIFGYGLIDALKAVRAASAATPTSLGVSTSTLNFEVLPAGGASQTITVSQLGSGAIAVTGATSSEPWLSIAPTNVDASGLGTYTVTASPAGLPNGVHTARLTFTPNAGTPVTVTVSMVLGAAAGSGGTAGHVYVLLLDAATLEAVAQLQVPATADGRYAYGFTGLAAGTYHIVAGSDMDSDDLVCDEGESCGAYPVLSQPGEVTLSGNLIGIDFSAGFPSGIAPEAAQTGPARRAWRRTPGWTQAR